MGGIINFNNEPVAGSWEVGYALDAGNGFDRGRRKVHVQQDNQRYETLHDSR